MLMHHSVKLRDSFSTLSPSQLLVEKRVSTTDHVAAPVQKEGTLYIMKI